MQTLFQSAQHIYEKREVSGFVPLTNGSGSRRPKKHADPAFKADPVLHFFQNAAQYLGKFKSVDSDRVLRTDTKIFVQSVYIFWFRA